ncbi:sulfite oxidase [Paenibacillus sp. P25]|nr:sulfite oxidase [Paenibacillus sp. P25]
MSTWRLGVQGSVRNPRSFTYRELLSMPQVTLPVTLECSGNKRALFHPKARGEQWQTGGVSHAVWTGVALRDILSMCGLLDRAREVVFEGLDRGERTDRPGIFAYARSLPLEKALHPHTIIALHKNGKPLPYKHGFPARLIVPGWYGMASVKWLHRIVVTDHAFQGPFQTVDYVYYKDEADPSHRRPVTVMKVNSVIARPSDQEIVRRGVHTVTGAAWSGEGPVVQAHVSVDAGRTWQEAEWLDPPFPYAWRRWRLRWNAARPGAYDIMVKALDASGRTHPKEAEWNLKGYGNNGIHHIRVYVD